MTASRHNLLGAHERWRVMQDDTLKLLPQLPDASVDAVVCDPPYGISFDNQTGTDARSTTPSPTTTNPA